MTSAKDRILKNYVIVNVEKTAAPAGRNCQAEINKIDAIAKTVSAKKIAIKDLHRLENACLTLVTKIREQRLS